MEPNPTKQRLLGLEAGAQQRPQVADHAFACAGGTARIAASIAKTAAGSGNFQVPPSGAEEAHQLFKGRCAGPRRRERTASRRRCWMWPFDRAAR